jgi:hypothetical protein
MFKTVADKQNYGDPSIYFLWVHRLIVGTSDDRDVLQLGKGVHDE